MRPPFRLNPGWIARTPSWRWSGSEFHPDLSPHGRWMAYVSDASGRWEVYVAPYPGPGPTRQVSIEGGSEPSWSPDGETLYFRSVGAHHIARQMLAARTRVSTRGGETVLETDPPRDLFDGPYFHWFTELSTL